LWGAFFRSYAAILRLWRSLGERTSLSKDNGLAHSLGRKPSIDLQCVSGEPPKPKRECAAGRTVTNRFETFHCQACGRGVKRKSRQQKFCSDRCRQFACREKAASQINGRTALKNRAEYHPTGSVTKPIFLSNKNKGEAGKKSGPSIPLNVLGGYRWPNAVDVDRGLLRKIVRAEIGAWVREKTEAKRSDREALKKALRDSLRALGRSRDLLPEVGFE
jgi:hypothetical protein